MILDNEVKEKLEQCGKFFPAIGLECIEAFTGVKGSVVEPWVILDRLPGNNPHNIMLGTGNNLYQAILAISFKSDADMGVIVSSSFEELIDAWGEFANTYSGMLMDKNTFTSNFGYLTQSIPQYSSGDVFYSKAWAFYGSIATNDNHEINLGFAIRKLLV